MLRVRFALPKSTLDVVSSDEVAVSADGSAVDGELELEELTGGAAVKLSVTGVSVSDVPAPGSFVVAVPEEGTFEGGEPVPDEGLFDGVDAMGVPVFRLPPT